MSKTMTDRKQEIIYKGHVITFYLGSNWAYVGNEIFQSVLGAKQAITRRINNKKTTVTEGE